MAPAWVLAAVAFAGCSFSGASNEVEPAVDAGFGELESVTLGVGDVAVDDTWLFEGAPDEDRGGRPDMAWDQSRDEGEQSGASIGLLRIDAVGNAAVQVPEGALVEVATLRLVLADGGDPGFVTAALVTWNDATTWNTFGPTPGADPADDYRINPLAPLPDTTIRVDGDLIEVDVTEAVAGWAAGESDLGWVLLASGGNGTRVYTSDEQDPGRRPELSVELRRSR
jgi:hypothetical protein